VLFRSQLAREVAGTRSLVPPSSPWARSVCLLDLAEPINHFGWLFKPVVLDGLVFAATLGFHEWGLPEDTLQLVKVPIEGDSPSFLGQAKIPRIDWINRWMLNQGPRYRLTNPASRLSVVRAACAGSGCYFAATASGVFIFPTDGGPVSRLCATNGLPSDEVLALAFLDDKLYIGAGEAEHAGYVVSYEPATHKLSVLASSRRSEHLSPLDDQPPFATLGFAAEPARHRLLMTVSSVNPPRTKFREINSSMGVWTYVPSEAKFERIIPLFLNTWAPPILSLSTWAGLADPNTLAVIGVATNALLDLRQNRVLPVSGSSAVHGNATDVFWNRPVRGNLGGTRTIRGPFLLRDGWFYSGRPFERIALSDGTREQLPPPRTDYEFEPTEALQLLDAGKHILAADQFSIWLLELAPETQRASAEDGRQSSAPIQK
jgi:hypothetical protein